ncbi:amidase [Alteribacter lacisalsi]|uniref:Amidase n=1 Tax=Alteribacter lacisalsi TaxID=2045244 RepID=A0A2W0H8L7_9BACI|nr:amidase [Alteribacter lacisalsi]PYZ98214.1 amidase [Alteribacter lacisalsi]
MDILTYKSLDAGDLAELVRKKEMKASELVLLSRQVYEKENPGLNAVVYERFEQASKEADRLKLHSSPLSGVPFLLKNISQALKGAPLTSGSRLLKDYAAPRDSHFTRKLKDAGLVMCGHTNTPEFGLKNITEPASFGPSRNPVNQRYSPGGSSGGAAAAVASGIVPAAGASDGGGSIRIPASFTGLTGLKPTRGRTPVGPGTGRQWQGAAIDFVITRSVRDCALFLEVLQTIQPEAAFQTPLYEGRYTDCVKAGLPKALRIGFSNVSPAGTPVSEDAVKAVSNTVKWLEKEGHHIEEAMAEIDGIDLMKQYYTMNSGEMAAVVKTLEHAFGRVLTSGDMEVESWVLAEAGKHVTAADYSLSLAAWDRASERMAAFHKSYDLFITPATASTAPEVGQLTMGSTSRERLIERISSADGRRQQEMIYEMFLPSLTYTPFTQLANLTGQPAVSLPVYKATEGLPLGVQVMASKGREDLLFALAGDLERSTLWCPSP